jgi:peptide/nickel transport system substrate-binding protein
MWNARRPEAARLLTAICLWMFETLRGGSPDPPRTRPVPARLEGRSRAAGQETRRAKSGHAILVLAITGILFLPSADAPAMQPPRFTPEQMGGTLRGNFNAEPQTLNPLTYKDMYARYVNEYVFESLIDRDPDTLELVGVLADKWEVSPDGLVITFHLNPKAKFSDAAPVTADDVVFTYETTINPKIDCRDRASYFEDCKGIEKIDDRTVRFTWKKPYFLSLEFSGIPVLPKHVYKFTDPNEFNDINDLLVGTGPYTFTKGDWKTGQHIILKRNKNYWGNAPAFDDIVYTFTLEEQPAVQAILAGELDFLPVTPEWFMKLRDRKDVQERFQLIRYSSHLNGYSYIGWNNARPPFNDARVRRAMTHLVWREQLLKYVMRDIGSVATGPFWPPSPQYDRSIKPWPFDREAARRLLKEAGWEDRNGDGWLENAEGKRFEFEFCSASGDQNTRDMVRVIGEEFRRMGIDMHVRLYEWSIFTVKLDNRDLDSVMLAWGGGNVEEDPYQVFHSSQIADRGSNFIGFRNAEADRLIVAARMTLDENKRNEMYHQLQQLFHREQPYTFMFDRQSLRLVSNRVKGARVHKMGMFPVEWWIGKEGAAAPRAAAGQGGGTP